MAEGGGYSLELLQYAAMVRKLFCGSLQVGCPVAAYWREPIFPGERGTWPPVSQVRMDL